MAEIRNSNTRELFGRYTAAFNDFLAAVIAPLIRERAVDRIAEPVLYSLEAGGKRFRPALLFLCAGLEPEEIARHTTSSDGPSAEREAARIEQALFAAAALECIHTYSLIHDDLPAMDNDEIRRGKPTCHMAFSEWEAILAGDALNTLAFDLLTDQEWEPRTAVGLVRLLARGAGLGGMICGQALDLHAEKNHLRDTSPDLARSVLTEIHLKKTAALIGTACEMGALLAGLTPPSREPYRRFGETLGFLFQVSDDLLDVTGDEVLMGKKVGKDEEAGKLTYPVLFGVEESRKQAAELSEKLLKMVETLPAVAETGSDLRFHLPEVARMVRDRVT